MMAECDIITEDMTPIFMHILAILSFANGSFSDLSHSAPLSAEGESLAAIVNN